MVHEMVNGSDDLMVGTPLGRKVGFHGGPDACADCGGIVGLTNDNGSCPHPYNLVGFLQPGRKLPLPYEVKDALLVALYQLGPEGGFRNQLLQVSTLSPSVLDGALRRSRRSNHVVRSHQREQLPVLGTAYRHKLSWRGLAYLWERFGLQFET
jgi:hypothetical protein